MSGETVALGDAGAWVSGGTPSTANEQFWGGDVPWMSSKSMVNFRIYESDRNLTPLGVAGGTKMVPKDAILMVVRGMSLKTEFRMGIAQRPVALSQDLKGLIARPDLDPSFLAYAIKSRTPEILDMVDEAGHGTGRLQTDRLFNLRLPKPPLEEQRAIAATLGALDDKIESNRRLISIIPALIRAHVEKATAATANHVPISSLATFVNGGAYTKGATGQGRMVIRIAELNGGPGGSTVYNELDVPDDKTARPGDLLMSWSGSLGVYRWARAEAIINQHIFKVLPAGWPAWLVFDRLDAVIGVLREIAKDKATTMGHIQRGHLHTTVVNVPDPETVASLDAILGPLWTRLLVAEQEILPLESLRDALLPELLSGRVRVADLA